MDIIRSQIKKAQSAESQVKRQLGRYRNLYANHAISLAEWEDIRDELTQKGAQVEELINQLKARQLPARQDEISKQRSMVAAAKLERDKALWDVQQTTIVSPVNAKVFDIIYRAGERPSAGKPIISLLPPENIKVRFFIPEAKLGKFKIGSKVKLICDGCAEPIAGVINYISPEAEFTPPVIYSTKRREKLIFMAEVSALQQAGRTKIGNRLMWRLLAMNNLCIDVKNLSNKHFGEHHVVRISLYRWQKARSMVFSVRTVAEKRHRFE